MKKNVRGFVLTQFFKKNIFGSNLYGDYIELTRSDICRDHEFRDDTRFVRRSESLIHALVSLPLLPSRHALRRCADSSPPHRLRPTTLSDSFLEVGSTTPHYTILFRRPSPLRT